MAPAVGRDPTTNKGRRQPARSKQISTNLHDATPPSPSIAEQHHRPRQEHQHDIAPSATSPHLPAHPPVISPTRSPTSPPLSSIQDAFRPQLSERDSIFATSYFPIPDLVTTPNIPGKRAREEGRSEDDIGRDEQHTPPASTMMAVSPLRSHSVDFSPALLKHVPPHAVPLFHHSPHQHTSRPSRTSLPPQSHRRSLYDLHDLGSLPASNTLHSQPIHDPHLPDTPLRRDDLPKTPASVVKAIDFADPEQSAEREKYRSWRQGQAKMNGMTIAETQRTRSRTSLEVDKIIDAQLPQPEPPMANVRSRKASHYLGLFKENEAEERRENEKKAKGKEGTQSQLSKDIHAKAREGDKRQPTIAEDVESTEEGNDVTVSREHMSKKLPLDLLEEIRNHDYLAPTRSKSSTHSKHVSAKLPHRRAEDLARSKTDDEESDQEHISSATYYPHQGVTIADSPTDDQLAERRPKDQKPNEREGLGSNDVQVSLKSDGASDFLQGQSSAEFDQLPSPAAAVDQQLFSDSDYESDAYGYDSTVSGEEDEVETTPTATPRIKAQHQRPSERRTSLHAPAPIGAVELKPFKHQVGGHTPVYRFSRRAVCKQLNSKENKFYETVEKHHTELLGYMPRYIGVLNVTYRKDQKKRRKTLSGEALQQDAKTKTSKPRAGDKSKEDEQSRTVSHSMQTPQAIPQVIFENNRHLIPDDLFRVPPRSATPDLHRASTSPPLRENQSDDETSNGNSRRPSLKPASSWGFTSVNETLRDHVLREVFAPPHIYKHDRRERAYHARSLTKIPRYLRKEYTAHPHRQKSVDVPLLQRTTPKEKPKNGTQLARLQHVISEDADQANSDLDRRVLESRKALSKSAEMDGDHGLSVPPPSRHHRRRHSGGGLKRKPTDFEGSRGDLEFHENEEEAYTADGEDVFAMEDVGKNPAKDGAKPIQPQSKLEIMVTGGDGPNVNQAPRLGPAISFGSPEPRNPETSLVQHDERVERFLLLEDLTAGMQKPCVLDLKMGTRQYGVEANEKKQASQRMKCKTTTSRELGVRVCGMQVFNVREQKYKFEDKYFGRDLKAGSEFQDALTRFFFDGIGHAQALKHIPSVLQKIKELDRVIRALPGYRLYASSLLMIYDRGDADQEGKVTQEINEDGKPAQYPDIKLKIVDFANCVTAEEMDHVLRKPCPPTHPESIDWGYLRGLRSLRMYFQKIYQDLHRQRYVERGEGEGMAIDQRGISNATTQKGWTDSIIEDPGEVSV